MSADHALRLWNLQTASCVLILGGERGHRDEVLSADFNLDCTKIVSCGMDHSLKIWNINTPEISAAIARSYDPSQTGGARPGKILVEHFPIFSTCAVHRNYVDCTRWLGDVVFSKSTDNQIVCWRPGGPPRLDLNEKRTLYLGDTVTVLQRYEMSRCNIWYLRFCIDSGYNLLAVGNQEGKVFLWNLRAKGVSPKSSRVTLAHKRCTSTIRQVAMNSDASILICVCDNSTVWRWDRTTKLTAEVDGSEGEEETAATAAADASNATD